MLASCDVAVARVRRVDGAGADGDCLEVADEEDGYGDCCCDCDGDGDWGDIGR